MSLIPERKLVPACRIRNGRPSLPGSRAVLVSGKSTPCFLNLKASSVFPGEKTELDDPSISSSVQSQSCLTLCDPMDCSTPSFPILHQLPEPAQTHVHQVQDAFNHHTFSPGCGKLLRNDLE